MLPSLTFFFWGFCLHPFLMHFASPPSSLSIPLTWIIHFFQLPELNNTLQPISMQPSQKAEILLWPCDSSVSVPLHLSFLSWPQHSLTLVSASWSLSISTFFFLYSQCHHSSYNICVLNSPPPQPLPAPKHL